MSGFEKYKEQILWTTRIVQMFLSIIITVMVTNSLNKLDKVYDAANVHAVKIEHLENRANQTDINLKNIVDNENANHQILNIRIDKNEEKIEANKDLIIQYLRK